MSRQALEQKLGVETGSIMGLGKLLKLEKLINRYMLLLLLPGKLDSETVD